MFVVFVVIWISLRPAGTVQYEPPSPTRASGLGVFHEDRGQEADENPDREMASAAFDFGVRHETFEEL
jgi:hypothetical protein